jgi:hypothetical protein
MTGDTGVAVTSFVGVVMIRRGLGSIISSESFFQKNGGFNALRVWPGERGCGLVSALRNHVLYAIQFCNTGIRGNILLSFSESYGVVLSAPLCMHRFGVGWRAVGEQLPTPPGGHYDSDGSIEIMHDEANFKESMVAISRV